MAPPFFRSIRKRKKALAASVVSGLSGVAAGEYLRVIPSNYQHIGARDNQEDAFAFSDLSDPKLVRECGILAVVADGMGGLSKGEEASQVAVNTFLREFMSKNDDEPIASCLYRAILVANAAVFDLAFNGEAVEDLGTTLVAVLVHMEQMYWISIGDSRIYLFREGRLEQLTTDHIYANHLQYDVDNGRITQKEADEHPERSYLTSYLGLVEVLEVDQSVAPLLLKPGDRILLCSDGLFDSLSDKDIEDTLKNGCLNAAEELVNQALRKENRHQDNVTVIVLSFLFSAGR